MTLSRLLQLEARFNLLIKNRVKKSGNLELYKIVRRIKPHHGIPHRRAFFIPNQLSERGIQLNSIYLESAEQDPGTSQGQVLEAEGIIPPTLTNNL